MTVLFKGSHENIVVIAAFCHDLNELLELVSVLEALPQDAMQRYTLQRLCDMRADAVRPEAWEPLSYAENIEEGYFSVPSVMERG